MAVRGFSGNSPVMRASRVFSLSRSSVTSLCWLLLAINGTALSLAAIGIWQADEVGLLQASPTAFRYGLFVTALVAIPLSIVLIEKLRDVETLEHEIGTLDPVDQLTGVLGKGVFERVLDDELVRIARLGRISALVRIEIDHHSSLVQRFGEASGQAVLTEVAQVTHRLLRGPFDKVGRWSDSSLVVLLHNVLIAEAETVCDRLGSEIGEQVFEFDREAVYVTASFGIAGFGPNDTPDDIFDRADQGARKAMRYGGNKRCNMG